MATFVIVHGAGGSAWEWHLVVDRLRRRGHDALAVDLPCEDEAAGLMEYADTVVAAIGSRSDVVLVAHSLGGFTAPLVCAQVPVRRMVLVAAMVPLPGETGMEFWTASGYEDAVRERAEREGLAVDVSSRAGLVDTFAHDVDPLLSAEAARRRRHQAMRPMTEPWPLPDWPDVPTSFLVLGDDRFFPPDFLHRLAKERLGVVADEMPGSHSAYLSRPAELARRLEGYAALGAQPPPSAPNEGRSRCWERSPSRNARSSRTSASRSGPRSATGTG